MTAIRRPTAPDLAALAAAAGVPIDATSLARFDAYRSLLLAWNTRTNLTAITDPDEVDRRLFLDSLLMLPSLDAALDLLEQHGSRTPYRLADVGSGGGFPGLPIKIMRSELDITLIEATGKKVAFLEAAIAELGLEQVRAVHARAEDLARDPDYRERFSLVTARGVASLPALLELGIPLLHVGGRALFPKGMEIEAELAAARVAAPLVGAEIVMARKLPGDQTTLVVAAKSRPTPAKYPRRAGIPAREPLGEGKSSSRPVSASSSGQQRHSSRPVPPSRSRTNRSSAARGTS